MEHLFPRLEWSEKRINQLFWAIFQLIFSQFLKERYRVLVWVLGDHPLHLWPQSTQKQPQNKPRYPQTKNLFLCPHYLSSRRVGIYSPSQIFAFGFFFHVNTHTLSLGGPSDTPMTPEHPKTAPKRAQIPPKRNTFSCVPTISHPGG